MTILRDISGPWSFALSIALFLVLCEPRYSKKLTITLTILILTPFTLFTEYLYFIRGSEYGGQAIVLTFLLPAMVIFWIFSKYRDGRFFSTFFYVQLISLLIIMLSNIADFFLTGESFILMFVLRLIAYPVVLWLAYTRVRKPYLEYQSLEPRGWTMFAVIAALWCILLLLMFNYPTILSKRPDAVPPFLLLAVLAPSTCAQYILNFVHLREISEAHERDEVLRLQAASLQDRLEQLEESQRATSIYRHDRRHRMRTLIELAENEDRETVLKFLYSTEETLEEAAPPARYCQNVILNAVLTAYIAAAEDAGIKTEYEFELPHEAPFDENAFSVVLANGLENAIRANKKLPPDERRLIIRCYTTPQLMLRISNPCRTTPQLDSGGWPVASAEGHGVGTISVRAYCEKHSANCSYRCADGVFTMTLVQAVNSATPQ